MSGYFFKIDKTIALSPELSNDELLAYVLIMMTKGKEEIGYFNYESLSYQATGTIKDTMFIKRIKNGFIELEQRSIIDILQETKNGKVINVEGLLFSNDTSAESYNKIKTKSYIVIEDQEVYKILSSGSNHRVNLLRYFIYVLSTLSSHNNDNNGYLCRKGTGYYSIDNLADLMGVNRNTIFHYNKWLEENGLLYINHSYDVILDEKGKIEKGIPNCYGRPKDSEVVNALQFALYQHYSRSRQMKALSKDANRRRSAAQKINNLQKGKEYTYSTLKGLYNFCKRSNEDKQNELEKLNEIIRKKLITEFDAKNRREQIMNKQDYDLEFIQNKIEEVKNNEVKNNTIKKEGGG